MPASAQSDISGRLELRINDCGNPNHQGAHSTYLLRDLKSRKLTELDVSKLDKHSLNPGALVKLRGGFKQKANPAGPRGAFEASEVIEQEVTAETQSASTGSGDEVEAAVEEPIVAEGAPTINTLSCILLFANTNNYTVQSSTITTVEGMLFNDTNNVSGAIEEATYGHYNLSHSATATVDLNTTHPPRANLRSNPTSNPPRKPWGTTSTTTTASSSFSLRMARSSLLTGTSTVTPRYIAMVGPLACSTALFTSWDTTSASTMPARVAISTAMKAVPWGIPIPAPTAPPTALPRRLKKDGLIPIRVVLHR